MKQLARFFSFIAFGFLLALTSSQWVKAATYTVCTSSCDFATIQAAVNAAAAGDIINVQAGTYNENVNLNTAAAGVDIYLRSVDGPGQARLGGSGIKISGTTFSGSLTVDGFEISSTDNDALVLSTFKNITVINSTFAGVGNTDFTHNAIELARSSGTGSVLVYNNTFTDVRWNAFEFALSDTADYDVNVLSNTVTGHSAGNSGGVTIRAAGSSVVRATVANNVITDTGGSGISIRSNDSPNVTAIVTNNMLDTTVGWGAIGIDVNTQNNSVRNFTITDNNITAGGHGIRMPIFDGGSITAVISRNTITAPQNNYEEDGIIVYTNTAANIPGNLLISDNTVNAAPGNGLYLRVRGSGTNFKATVTGNEFSNTVQGGTAGNYGSKIETDNSASLTLKLTGNTVNNDKNFALINTSGAFAIDGSGASAQAYVDGNNTNTTAAAVTSGTITLDAPTITPPTSNRRPTAVADSANAAPAVALLIDVLANDTDPDDDALTIASFDSASQNGASIAQDGSMLVYTAPADFSGVDSFYYVVSDSAEAQDVAQVTVNVAPLAVAVAAGEGPGGIGTVDGASALALWLRADAGAYADSSCTTAAAGGNGIACWADQSGRNNQATRPDSGPLYQPDQLNGQAVIRFDGSPAQGLSVAHDGNLDHDGAYGVFLVQRIDQWRQDDHIMRKSDYPGGATQYELALGGNGPLTDRLYAYAGGDGGEGAAVYSDPVFEAGQYILVRTLTSYDDGQATVAFFANGAGAGSIQSAGQTQNSSNDLSLGSFMGDVAELILYDSGMIAAQRVLVENYLSARYDIALSSGDRYAGDAAGTDYDRDVAGIGQESDGRHSIAHSAGLIITDTTFLADDGDYLLVGHDGLANTAVTSDLPAYVMSRWSRIWYFDQTDVNENGGMVQVAFDFGDSGSGDTPGDPHVLLSRSGTSGDFAIVASSPSVEGDRVLFTVDVAALPDGFYTLGLAGAGPGGVSFSDGGSSLVTWLRADAGVAADVDGVHTWADQSGYGHHVTQADDGQKPAWQDSAIGGQPALLFDGASDFMASDNSSALAFSQSPHTVLAVVDLSDTAEADVVGSGDTVAGHALLMVHDGAARGQIWRSGVLSTVDSAAAISAGQPFLLGQMVTDSDINVILNGRLSTTALSGTVATAADRLYLGSRDGSLGFAEGAIAEVIVFKDALSAAERTHVELYLMDKYGIDLGGTGLYGSSTHVQNVRGIGHRANVTNSGNSAGLSINDTSFLNDSDDVIILGHDSSANAAVTSDLPGEVGARWERAWYVEVNDAAGTDGGSVEMIFDLSDAGLGGAPVPVGRYRLLARSGTSGAFSVVASASSVSDDQIVFSAPVGSTLQDGRYYTLGIVNNPPVIEDQVRSIDENSANGTEVGLPLSASDPDAGDAINFSIVAGNSNNAFTIEAATGQITVNNSAALDFEVTPVFTLAVEVSDGGNLTNTASITVNLNDVNEVPTIADQSRSVDENSHNGTSVGLPLTATDPDDGDGLVFAITAGNIGNAFTIDSSTGQLSVHNSAALDFETTPVFTLTVEVTDSGHLAATATVTVSLNDINDAPEITGTAGSTAFEGQLYSFTPAVDDADGDVLTFSIENKPEWATFDPANGRLSGSPGVSHRGTYNNIAIKASDGELETSLPVFAITIIPIGGAAGIVTPADGGRIDQETISIDMPPGAITQTLTLVYEPLDAAPSNEMPGSFLLGGRHFKIEAYLDDVGLPGYHFVQPITLTIHYEDAAVKELDETSLELWYWDVNSNAWQSDGITIVMRDTANNQLVVSVTHLTDFAIVGGPAIRLIYMPIIFSNGMEPTDPTLKNVAVDGGPAETANRQANPAVTNGSWLTRLIASNPVSTAVNNIWRYLTGSAR